MAQPRWHRITGQVMVVVVLAASALAFVAAFAPRHGFFDLDVYYGAIHYWRSGGEIYDYVRPRSSYGFTYPPFAALTMLPMAVVAWPVAIAVHVSLTVVATVWLLWALLTPMIRRQGWTVWFALAIALCLVTVYEPMRETFLFGQVNMLLLAVVAADLLYGVARGRPWAGVGVGLALAIKLTPGVFLLYLLVTKRWRAAAVATGTAAAATLLAGALAPDASREFWTAALWDTDRVGVLSFISNQSLQGVVARLSPDQPSRAVWLLAVLAVLAVWLVRSRRAASAGDEVAGLALTGTVGLLISPVTWVHHLVWLLPSLILVVERGSDATGRRRAALLTLATVSYALLCSRIVWLWMDDFSGLDGALGSNTYVWISLALLLWTPLRLADRGEQERPGDHGRYAVSGTRLS